MGAENDLVPVLEVVSVKVCEPEVTITEGALRQVSEVREGYVTQQGSVGKRMGLGFNVCVAPTLTFCPCISEGGMN